MFLTCKSCFVLSLYYDLYLWSWARGSQSCTLPSSVSIPMCRTEERQLSRVAMPLLPQGLEVPPGRMVQALRNLCRSQIPAYMQFSPSVPTNGSA